MELIQDVSYLKRCYCHSSHPSLRLIPLGKLFYVGYLWEHIVNSYSQVCIATRTLKLMFRKKPIHRCISLRQVSRFLIQNVGIIIILMLGSFFRFNHYSSQFIWNSDHGRDTLVAYHIIHYQEFITTGPHVAVHVGDNDLVNHPFFYYLLALLYLISNNPITVGVIYAIIFHCGTILLIYEAGKEISRKPVGLLASLLFAVSPLSIHMSQSLWTPHFLPFIGSLSIYLLVKFSKIKYFTSLHLFILCILMLSYLSIEYSALLMTPAVCIFIIYLYKNKNCKFKINPLAWISTILLTAIWILPILLNFTFLMPLLHLSTNHPGNLPPTIKAISDVSTMLLQCTLMPLPINTYVLVIFYLFLAIPSFMLLIYRNTSNNKSPLPWLLFSTLILGIIISLPLASTASTYIDSAKIEPHHFYVLLPLLYIIFSTSIYFLFQQKHLWKLLSTNIVFFVLFVLLRSSITQYFLGRGNSSYQQYQHIVNTIHKDIIDNGYTNFYVVATDPENPSFNSWFTAKYWYGLEKLTKQKLTTIVNTDIKDDNYHPILAPSRITTCYFVCYTNTSSTTFKCIGNILDVVKSASICATSIEPAEIIHTNELVLYKI